MKREAIATWKRAPGRDGGDLFVGGDRIDRTPSLTWEQLSASPFDLLASVQAGCLARAVAQEMADEEMEPQAVAAHAVIELDIVHAEWEIRDMRIEVTAHADHGLSEDFGRVVERSRRRCPILNALRVPVAITSQLEIPACAR